MPGGLAGRMQASQSISGPLLAQSTEPSRAVTVLPLFHAAWLFALGTAFSHAAWLRPSIMLVALCPTVFLCIVAALRAHRIVWIPLAALWILVGAWCAEMEPQPAPSTDILTLSDGLLRTVEGTVVDAAPMRTERIVNTDEASSEGPSQRIDVRVSSLELMTDTDDRQIPVDGKVRLTVRWPQPASGDPTLRSLGCGARLRVVARLLPPQQYRDPGAWSRRDYLLDQGVTATTTVNAAQVESLGYAQQVPLRCRIAALQRDASARLLGLPVAMRRLPPGFASAQQ